MMVKCDAVENDMLLKYSPGVSGRIVMWGISHKFHILTVPYKVHDRTT